ncbi:MAG TPA: TonB-dependent receptor, partial [Thermoanaerobaculia bacterium]|nr:TonB-dependent receptor [Thermoanaerobaculia bacterium]
NDKWDWNARWTFNLGLRYDKNHVVDASGNLVSDDSKVSPRLGVIWDVTGNGATRVNASYATYVTKIVDGNVGGAGNNAGSPAQFSFRYAGPVINPIDPNTKQIIGTPVGPQDALKIIFDWFDAQGGINMSPTSSLRTLTFFPGYSQRILSPITSPSVNEVTVGVSQQFGRSLFVRGDLVHRKWKDFYGLRLDTSTGTLAAPNGSVGDLAVLINDNSITRKYDAAQLQFGYHPGRWNLGGGYTFSKLKGNDNTENDGTASSPNTPLATYYPEVLGYSQRVSDGYIPGDSTHRAKIWGGYDLPTFLGNFNFSVLQSADSGRAYSASANIDINRSDILARLPASYTTSQLSTQQTYFFRQRGSFRTPSYFSTDLSINYALPISRVEVFAQGQVLNVFNNSKVNNIVNGQLDNTVRTSLTAGSGLASFNPFTTTPVECPQSNTAAQCTALGANYQFGPLFGQGLSKDAYQTPRTYRVSFGLRF